MTDTFRRQRRRTLTDKMVAAMPRKRKRYTVADPEQRGLYLRVPPQGPITYAVVCRDPYGKQLWTTIGGADVLSIEQGREQAREVLRRVKAGLPAVEPPPPKPETFETVAEGWLKRHVAEHKLRTAGEIERCLKKYVHPFWATREFVSLRRTDITRLREHIEDNHGRGQADHVLAFVRSISTWYAGRVDDYVSPFVGLRRSRAAPRDRILNDDELRALWSVTEGAGAFNALVRILLLTAQRLGKAQALRWDAIDAEGVWHIPTAPREKGHGGPLQLPSLALDVINAQPRFASNEHVFAAGRGTGHCNDFDAAKKTLDGKLPPTMPHWTLHDLRRTARSLMSRAGVRPDVAERVLGHSIGGVAGIYDRHRYDDEKAEALARLAALVERIVNPPDAAVVVPLRPVATVS